MRKLGSQEWKTLFNISPIYTPTVLVAEANSSRKQFDQEPIVNVDPELSSDIEKQ